jgi:hypothetical protein
MKRTPATSSGPAGTKVTIRVHTDKPVRRGAVALQGAAALPLKAEDAEATTLAPT